MKEFAEDIFGDLLNALGAAADAVRKLEEAAKRDVLTIYTNLRVDLFDVNGALKDSREIHNVICTAGKNQILLNAAAKTVSQFSYIAIGTGTTAAAAGDTALVTESARANSTLSQPSAGTLRFTYTFPAGTGTGAVTESGLFDANAAGNVFARQVFSVINKGASDTLQITWDIT